MIKLEQIHTKDLDTFVPQQFLDKLNKEIQRQWDELLADGTITVHCKQHWPRDAGVRNDKPGTWFDNRCGTCGKTIFPHSWVADEK